MAIVFDASVAASWFLPGERSPATDLVLDGLAATQGVVPGLFWHEHNVIVSHSVQDGRLHRPRKHWLFRTCKPADCRAYGHFV